MGANGRSRSVVDVEFQSRFIFKFALAMMLSMVASIVLFNYLAINALESLKWKMIIYEKSIAEVVMPYMLFISALAVLFTALLLFVASRFLRRDMVGVIYRLNKDMEDVAKGNYRLRIGLRKADPFKDTANELDKVVTSLRGRLRNTNLIFEDTMRLIRSIGEVREEYLPGKCSRLVQNVKALEKSLENNLQHRESGR